MTTANAGMTDSEPAMSDEALASTAKALAHPARVRIVRYLLTQEQCIGGDIVGAIGLAQSTVSEHLRILKKAGVVHGEIERPRICYSLKPSSVAGLAALLEHVLRHPGNATGDGARCTRPEARA